MLNLNALLYMITQALLLVAISTQDRKQKISEINVLLPICESKNCNKVYYTIYGYGGCYEW
jgi:hypothetical protein